MEHHLQKCFWRSVLAGAATLLAVSIPVDATQRDNSTTISSANTIKSPSFNNRIIIKYKANAIKTSAGSMSQASIDRLSSVAGVQLGHMRQIATGAHVMTLEQSLSGYEVNKIIANLENDPNIEYVERDIMLRPMAVPNDLRYSEQWHYFESVGGLNLPSAWDVTQGEGVVVAVVDTGYRPHVDLNANVLPGYDMISDTSVAQDGDGRDDDATDVGDWQPAGACILDPVARNSSWHGTHVAGTVAAVGNNGTGVTGVAYKAKTVPVRALGRCGGFTSDIADSIIWAAGGNVSAVPANANPAKVINLSLGAGAACSVTSQAAINIARSLGATVVASAGNHNGNADNWTPANCMNVITVAAVNRQGGKAFYSAFGNVVDVAAPGGEISVTANGVLSTLNTGVRSPGNDSYAFYEGTSMAAPHVAGVAALLYAVKPNITPHEVESTLKDTARNFPATCNQCGSGIVDAFAAVAAASCSGVEFTSLGSGPVGCSHIGGSTALCTIYPAPVVKFCNGDQLPIHIYSSVDWCIDKGHDTYDTLESAVITSPPPESGLPPYKYSEKTNLGWISKTLNSTIGNPNSVAISSVLTCADIN